MDCRSQLHNSCIPQYNRNQLIISKYSNGEHTKYKLVYMSTLRVKGVEDYDPTFFNVDIPVLEGLPGDSPLYDPFNPESPYSDEYVGHKEDVVEIKSSSNVDNADSKLVKNIYRARSTIYELAYCNEWDWFFTGTIDGGKHDRTDLEEYRKKFTQMIRDNNKYYSLHTKYFLVPELHADMKSWHVHGFLSGLPVEYLHKFQLGDQMSTYIADKVRRGQDVYNWERYQKSFGWCDLEPIASHEGACKYVTKYISKALDKSVSDIGKHMFYASLGLNRRTRVLCEDIKPDMLDYMNNHPRAYKGDYSVCLWLDSLDDVKNLI